MIKLVAAGYGLLDSQALSEPANLANIEWSIPLSGIGVLLSILYELVFVGEMHRTKSSHSAESKDMP